MLELMGRFSMLSRGQTLSTSGDILSIDLQHVFSASKELLPSLKSVRLVIFRAVCAILERKASEDGLSPLVHRKASKATNVYHLLFGLALDALYNSEIFFDDQSMEWNMYGDTMARKLESLVHGLQSLIKSWAQYQKTASSPTSVTSVLVLFETVKALDTLVVSGEPRLQVACLNLVSLIVEELSLVPGSISEIRKGIREELDQNDLGSAILKTILSGIYSHFAEFSMGLMTVTSAQKPNSTEIVAVTDAALGVFVTCLLSDSFSFVFSEVLAMFLYHLLGVCHSKGFSMELSLVLVSQLQRLTTQWTGEMTEKVENLVVAAIINLSQTFSATESTERALLSFRVQLVLSSLLVRFLRLSNKGEMALSHIFSILLKMGETASEPVLKTLIMTLDAFGKEHVLLHIQFLLELDLRLSARNLPDMSPKIWTLIMDQIVRLSDNDQQLPLAVKSTTLVLLWAYARLKQSTTVQDVAPALLTLAAKKSFIFKKGVESVPVSVKLLLEAKMKEYISVVQ
jgi:hypothetical protein